MDFTLLIMEPNNLYGRLGQASYQGQPERQQNSQSINYADSSKDLLLEGLRGLSVPELSADSAIKQEHIKQLQVPLSQDNVSDMILAQLTMDRQSESCAPHHRNLTISREKSSKIGSDCDHKEQCLSAKKIAEDEQEDEASDSDQSEVDLQQILSKSQEKTYNLQDFSQSTEQDTNEENEISREGNDIRREGNHIYQSKGDDRKQQRTTAQQSSQFMEQVEEYSTFLGDADFTGLFNQKKLLGLLNLLKKEQYMLPTEIRNKLIKFLNLIKARVEFYPYAEQIFKNLLQTTQDIERQYEYVGSRRMASITENLTDKGFQHFVQEYETKPRRQAMYYLENEKEPNRRISLAEFIANNEAYFKNEKWKDIFFMTQHIIEEFNLEHESRDNKEIQKILRKKIYSQNFYKHQISMPISCLGCIPYFVMNWNVYDEKINKTKIAFIPKASSLLNNDSKKATLEQVRKEVCGLANCGGGVILFDCERTYTNIIPRGQFLIEREVEEIERSIQETLKDVYPRPNVKIQFVPIAKDPLVDYDPQKPEPKVELFDSLSVVRLVVRPGQRTVQYSYKTQDGQYWSYYRYRSIFQTEGVHVRSKKVEKPTPLKFQQIGWIQSILEKPYSCFSHEQCLEPKQCKRLKEKNLVAKAQENYQKKFQYASAMVAKKENIEQIKLKLRKYNFDFELVHPFGHHNLRGASATAILYHNDPFSEILATISYNKEFQFDGRYVVVVAITDYIRLSERSNKRMFPKADLDALQTWATNQFKKENLKVKLYKYVNEKSEVQIYLKTDSKACNLLLYLVLNHHNEKAVLREPKDMTKVQCIVGATDGDKKADKK